MGRSAAAGAGQPGRRAQARLRHHPGRGGDHGRSAQRGHPLRGDRPAGGPRADRAARVGRPPPAIPHHDGRRRGAGPAVRADEQGRLGGQGTAEHASRLGRSMSPPLARAVLALYPPSWRARYGVEVLALLDDSGGGPAAVASLAWHALPAWFYPPRHLHDRPARLAGGGNGVSQGWFGVITLAGFAAAATAAAGPGLALRRLQPRGPALRLAATAAGVSAGVMAVAAVAIVIAVTSLDLWARQFAGYHDSTLSGIYLALVVVAAAVTTVSATRGTRAALAHP